MGVIYRGIKRIVDLWIAFQVELHGQYSFERMRRYDAFAKTASTLRVIGLCLLTPFPCLVLITLIDAVPLAHPDTSTNANYVHWIRNYLAIVFISYAMLGQFPLSVLGLPLGLARITVTSFVASLGGVGFQFVMSHVIGFPLPFSLVIGTPMWVAFICVTFAYYFAALLRANAQFRVDLGNYFVAFIAQSIDAASQNVYVILLPIIKIALKNWMSRFLGSMDDMKPEIVIFNVEIFNALYVACCMQSSALITTTLILSFVDWCQAWLSIRDVNEMLDDMTHFMHEIPQGHPWARKNFVEIALCIIDNDTSVKTHPSLRPLCIASTRVFDEQLVHRSVKPSRSAPVERKSVAVVPVTANPVAAAQHTHAFETEPSPDAVDTANNVASRNEGAAAKYAMPAQSSHDTKQHGEANMELFTDAQRLHFVQKATQLLFTTEFALLIEYTEVIIPVIYSMYVVAAYHLPNRAYYAQLAKMNPEELERTVSNVLVYASFELLSFLVMTYILRRKLQFRSFRQLAFVLDAQWMMVQSKLVLWFFYAVQNSLTHFGADFSFRFAWLHSKAQSPVG